MRQNLKTKIFGNSWSWQHWLVWPIAFIRKNPLTQRASSFILSHWTLLCIVQIYDWSSSRSLPEFFEESLSLSLHLHTICFVRSCLLRFAFQIGHECFAKHEITRLVALRMLSIENMVLRKVKVVLGVNTYLYAHAYSISTHAIIWIRIMNTHVINLAPTQHL